MKRPWLLLLVCGACASQPSPTKHGPESARPRCSSFAAPEVSAATVEHLAHASNVIEYENAWKADHPGATTGTISGSEVRSIIHSKMADVQSCYAAALSGGDGGGRVVVRFLIDEGGRVLTAQVGANSFGTPEVGCCLVNRVASWQFPKPTSGFVSVEYPFVVRISH